MVPHHPRNSRRSHVSACGRFTFFKQALRAVACKEMFGLRETNQTAHGRLEGVGIDLRFDSAGPNRKLGFIQEGSPVFVYCPD